MIFTIYMTLSKLLFDLKSPDVQNNMIGKARTEIACTLSWFGNWSEDQRNEFGKVLQKNENQGNDDASIEALMSTMTQMSLGTASKEGPSVFECQLKIFSKWYGSWSPAETSEFASQLNSIHPEFVASLNAQMLYNLR